MGWDSTRPVPWQRLMREWVIYALIMTAVFLVLFRGTSTVGAVAGVLVSGPLYLALGYVLAKFGYQRKTMKELRAERTAAPAEGRRGRSRTASEGPARARPAPTRRTAATPGRPAPGRKRPPRRKR